MKIRNTGTASITIPKVINGKKSIIIPANGVVTLFDEDVERNETILKMLKSGRLEKISDEEPYETSTGTDADKSSSSSESIDKVIQWIRNGDANISFVTEPRGIVSSIELENDIETDLVVGVTDADGNIDIFANNIEVELVPSAGITVTPTSGILENGILNVKVTATQSGTITLSNNKGLNNIELVITVA